MSNSVSYGKRGYLAFKKETTAGAAVYPDTFAEFLETTLPNPWNIAKTNTVQGNRSLNTRSYIGAYEPAELEVSLPAEPTISGHLLNGCFGDETASTLATGIYQHDFQPQNTQDSYTLDFAVGGEDYITRYFGCRISKLALAINDNRADWTVGFMAQRWFVNARLTVAIATGTTLTLDQTSGITTSDTIQVLDADNQDTVLATYTLSAVPTETTLTTVETIAVSLAVGDVVVIKRNASPSYTALGSEFIFTGGAEISVGTSTNPVDNTTATSDMTNFSCEFTNNLEAENAATGNDVVDRMPSRINLLGFDVSDITLSHLHANPDFVDALRSKDSLGLRIKFLGDALASNAAAAASLTIETDGIGTASVTVDATGEAGNDYNLTIVGGGAALAAALSGKNITLTLDAVAANNTTTLVAAAIHALTGVACASTGSDLVTTADNTDMTSPLKKNFSGGRDASEKTMLRIDIPNAKLQPIELPISDGLITEELKFTSDHDRAGQGTGNLSSMAKVRLRNATATY